MALKKPFGEEIGQSGTIITSGIITGQDYNTKLTGQEGIKIYDQMRKSDATVRASLLAVKLPILSANWFITPASDDQKDREIADFVDKNFFGGMTITWRDFLRQALLMLDYGRMVFEKVFELRDGKIVLKKLAPRLPSTIYRWQTEDGQDGVTQQLSTGGVVSIPIEKLVIFVNEKEGDNWEGTSLLRSSYKHFYIKDALYKIDAIAHERQGLGVPYVKLPKGATESDKRDAEEVLRNLRANEEAYVKIPDGWEVGFMNMQAGTVRNPMASILHHDRQITKNVLAQFLELGATQTGSFALSRDQSELFLMADEAVARTFAEAMNRYVIPQLVDLNFPGISAYPQLDFAKIGRVDFVKLTQSLFQLFQMGMLTTDQNLEDYLRDVMYLPAADESARLKGAEDKSGKDAILALKERVDAAIEAAERGK